MAHTVNAVVHDGNGILQMIVIPDDDSQLADPSFNPAGCVQLRVPHMLLPDSPATVSAAHIIDTARAMHPHLNLRHAPPETAPEEVT